jgi:predicted nuclease of predicted toxin-antitoxin system
MEIRFQADNDLKRAIVSGVLRRQQAVDFQDAADAHLHGLPDEEVLALAAREGRILVSHDRSTMPVHFANFIATQDSPGLILIEQSLPVREAIEELLLIWEASSAEEWVNRLEFIPL